ncbi:hypothetical protein DQP56_14790 [Mycolicibacter senuensis]|nr:hypothetical protein DQP56_14790 [Mycolicibacter senuensis]
MPQPTGTGGRSGRGVDAFLAAAQGGDFDALLRVRGPDITCRQHTLRGVAVMTGSSAIAEAVRRGQGARGAAGRHGSAAASPSARQRPSAATEVNVGRLRRTGAWSAVIPRANLLVVRRPRADADRRPCGTVIRS